MANEEDIQLLWKNAFAAYERETDHKLNREAWLRGLESTDDLIERIETQGLVFRDWRNKHHRLWLTLSRFAAPITALGGIAQQALGSTPWAPATAVLGSVLYLITSCENVSNAYDWVEQVFAELQEFSDRLTQYTKSTMDTVLKKKVTAILGFILKIIGRSEVLIRKDRFREYLRVTFLGKDEKTKALLDDLNKLMKNEQSYVLAVTYSSSKATEAIAGRVEHAVIKQGDDMQQIGQAVENLSIAVKGNDDKDTQRENDATLAHTLNESSACRDVDEIFATFSRGLLKGSGAWLQKEPLFNTWINQAAPILWVFGGPGAGKSYLSTWTIMRLMELHDQRPEHPSGVSVGFFYIKENREVLRDPNMILKTLAWQITLVDPIFRKHAITVCKAARATITAEDTWEKLFLDFYQSERARDRYAFLVLDGLDEASPTARLTILGLLRGLVASGSNTTRAHVQFAVFGRATLRGEMAFAREEKYINVSADKKNYDDIDRYIQKRLEEVELLKELRKAKPNGPQQANKTGKRIKKKVLDGADGVFLWAQLLLDQIVKKDLTQIEKILASPPASLDDMIWSVFERLAKDEDMDHESVRKLLAWAAFARRPLLFGEIDLILSLPTQKPNFLLWNSLRGRFASIFNLNFPEGFDPDDGDREGMSAEGSVTESGEQTEQSEEEKEAPAFDFTGDDEDDDEDGPEFDDTGIVNADADHGLEGLATRLPSPDDRSALHIFNDDQLRTVVTFSHQRIRDYLVREGSPTTRRKPPMDLNLNVQRIQIDITITCLDILCLDLASKPDTVYLVDYPAKHFVWHLGSIDKAAVRKHDTKRILEGLYFIFHQPAGIKSLFVAARAGESEGCDDFWRTWYATDRHSKAVQAWFQEIDTVASEFNDDAVEWMKSASMSIKELFKPLAFCAATTWLTKPSYNSKDYLDKSEFLVYVLQGYFALDDEGSLSSELRDWVWHRAFYWDIEAKELQYFAEWAELEQDTHWHTGLAWILMEGEYYTDAISHFKKALEQDVSAWVAQEGLARSYGEQGFYEEAIAYMESAAANLPESMEWLAGYLYPRISEWKNTLGDSEGAFAAAQQAYDAESYSPLAQLRFIEALDSAGASGKIMEVVRDLDCWRSVDQDYTYFVRLLSLGYDPYHEVGRACRVEGQPEFVLTAMDRALSLIDQSSNDTIQIWTPARMASFRYNYYDQVEEPMQLWETVLKRIAAKDTPSQKVYSRDRKTYSNSLGLLYFDAAVAARKAGTDTSRYATKLKGLSVITETSTDDDDGFDFFGTGYPSMLWGRWLRDYEGADDSLWRKCFKARLLEEMDMLDDDDPSNDTAGLHALAVTLFEAGDRTNAGAILAILFKPLEDEPVPQQDLASSDESDEHDEGYEIVEHGTANTSLIDKPLVAEIKEGPPNIEPANSADLSLHIATESAAITTVSPPPSTPAKVPSKAELKLQLQDSWMYTCDGCDRDAQDAGEMYFCEVCLNKNYCGDCLSKVKVQSLPARQCSAQHDFYRAWPIPSEARDMAAEWSGKEVALRKEWLERLRSEWMKAV